MKRATKAELLARLAAVEAENARLHDLLKLYAAAPHQTITVPATPQLPSVPGALLPCVPPLSWPYQPTTVPSLTPYWQIPSLICTTSVS